MTTISSGRQQPAFNMPWIRAEAILPNPRNPKVMNDMEVIRLRTGCKGEALGVLWWGEAPERPQKPTGVQRISMPEVYVRPKCVASRCCDVAGSGRNRCRPTARPRLGVAMCSSIFGTSGFAKPVSLSGTSPHQRSRLTLQPTFLKP